MSASTTNTKRIEALKEVAHKVQTSLHEAIASHVGSFTPEDGLDYLDSKNSILLSYLIELTYWLRCQMAGEDVPEACLHRLLEMRTILDKVRVLDKKLRYQIDKLLTYQTDKHLATVGDDPLLYRPRVDDDDNDDSSGRSGSDSDEDEEEDAANVEDMDDDDDDDDLATARLTVAMAQEKKKLRKSSTDGVNDDNDGLYHAPRHAAVPYTHDHGEADERRQKRRLQRLRASEVAETIRHQYSETPELEDSHGAASIGKQRASSRRIAEQQEERTAFEEDNMIRLTVSRKEKKDRKRMIREETSNLHAISDLGNLVNESSLSRGKGKGKKSSGQLPYESKSPQKKSRKAGPMNSLQAALQGSEKRKKRR